MKRLRGLTFALALSAGLGGVYAPFQAEARVVRDPPPEQIAERASLTPLMKAVQSSNVGKVKAFLKNKANVNAKSKAGVTALMLAAADGHAEIVKLLLKAGADPNAQDKEKNSALMYLLDNDGANERGTLLQIAKLLIAAKAKVNLQNSEGDYPLLIAASMGEKALVKLLLEAGANPRLKNKRGESAENDLEPLEEKAADEAIPRKQK